MSSGTESRDSGRRRGSAPKAGSVWESRMKIDQFKGGIKVFENSEQTTAPPNSEIEISNPKQSPSGKRKTWKSESSDASTVKIAALRSDLSRNAEELRKSPVSIRKSSLRKAKSDSMDEKIKSCDGDGDGDGDEGEKKSRSDEDCEVIKGTVSSTANCVNGGDGLGLDGDKEIEVEKKSVGDNDDDDKQKRIVIEEKKFVQRNQKTVPISSISRNQNPPPVNHARFHQIPSKITNNNSDNFQRIPRTNSRLQSFVELVMWRDVSKSAFVFGIGSFAIISSSFTEGINISFISVISYLGLVYLAAIFIFRSLISRGRGSLEKDNGNQDCVIGEEEAIWVIKLLLPFMNECLLKLRALFSGDPSTTMKLALLLFILARCGSSITIWTTAKLGFIGVFTVPKVYSAYSSQITAYGTFWMRRLRDAWASCSHKRAIGFAVFALVWNLSSVVARIWAVFMLFVAFKHHQQSLIKEGWARDEAMINGQDRRTTVHNTEKLKKAF